MIVALIVGGAIIGLGAWLDNEHIESYITGSIALIAAIGLPSVIMKIVEKENPKEEVTNGEETT